MTTDPRRAAGAALWPKLAPEMLDEVNEQSGRQLARVETAIRAARADALAEIADLIRDARCGYADPSLRMAWGRHRRQLLDEALAARQPKHLARDDDYTPAAIDRDQAEEEPAGR